MDVVAVVLMLTLGAGVVLGRCFQLHSLVVGLIVGLPGGVLAVMIAGAAMSPAAVGFGCVAWLVCAVVGVLGAFAGWLRRDYLHRNKS